jgi:hypothetical protein
MFNVVSPICRENRGYLNFMKLSWFNSIVVMLVLPFLRYKKSPKWWDFPLELIVYLTISAFKWCYNRQHMKKPFTSDRKPWWHTTLAVWAPIIAVAAIYGVVYGVADITMHNAYNTCESKTTQNETQAPSHNAFSNVPGQYDCTQSIRHNKLGLPYFIKIAY